MMVPSSHCTGIFEARSGDLMVLKYLDSPLRVETLSFEEAADFNPQD